jgi:hypothetical protein
MSSAAISRGQQRALMEVALRVRRLRDGLPADGPGLDTLRAACPSAQASAADGKDSVVASIEGPRTARLTSDEQGRETTPASNPLRGEPGQAARLGRVAHGVSGSLVYSGRLTAGTMRSLGFAPEGPSTAWSIRTESAIRFSVLGKSRQPLSISRNSWSESTSSEAPVFVAP